MRKNLFIFFRQTKYLLILKKRKNVFKYENIYLNEDPAPNDNKWRELYSA